MNNQVSEKYIELTFRYVAALYQQALGTLAPTLKDKVKLESYQNEAPTVRRKYYIDKMYHSLTATTRAKLMIAGGFESVKLFVRRFAGYSEDSMHPSSSRALYYVAGLPRHLAILYAKYIALIWVMKQKSFLRKLIMYASDLNGSALTAATKYTFYEGELADFLRIPFRKMQGRGRWHNYARNSSAFSSFLLKYSYLLGERPAPDATGVWTARKSLSIPLYVPGPKGIHDHQSNQVHVGHNQKTLASLMFLLRFMNALEPAGNQKVLGAKKIDDGQAFAHQAMSNLFLGPIFDSWMTSTPVYSPCSGGSNDISFGSAAEMAGYFFGDFPIAASRAGAADTGDPNHIVETTCDSAANIMVRHAIVKAGLETRDTAVIKSWISRVAKDSVNWIKNTAENYFATWQFGLQGLEMGTDSKFWAVRRQNSRNYGYGYDFSAGEVQPEPFCMSYLAKTAAITKTLTDSELKPVLAPSATDPRVTSVKTATDLFPNHFIRDLLMAENTDELFGFTMSQEPTDEEINRLADYLMANVSSVTVQYEPVLNMMSALSTALDNGMDHIKAYTRLGLILRGYKRFNLLPSEIAVLPRDSETSDEPVDEAILEPSWVKAVKYAGEGLAFAKDAQFLNELLDAKIEAAINLKNYNGRQEDARPARVARTRAPRTVS